MEFVTENGFVANKSIYPQILKLQSQTSLCNKHSYIGFILTRGDIISKDCV